MSVLRVFQVRIARIPKAQADKRRPKVTGLEEYLS